VAQADASYTLEPGMACEIQVADCLPVLLADRQGRAVAAAHAGWRGLSSGVLEATVAVLCREAGLAPRELQVWLGPCIGPSAFEVGDEVRAAFMAQRPSAARHFRPQPAAGKWLADLPGLARDRLGAVGVHDIGGNDGSPAWCTVSDASRFFSYRRDRLTGRHAAAVWLRG
jgi:polyphenol oxidase